MLTLEVTDCVIIPDVLTLTLTHTHTHARTHASLHRSLLDFYCVKVALFLPDEINLLFRDKLRSWEGGGGGLLVGGGGGDVAFKHI